jgi:ribosomal protein S27AE
MEPVKCPQCGTRMVEDDDDPSLHCPDCGWMEGQMVVPI